VRPSFFMQKSIALRHSSLWSIARWLVAHPGA
jgi:hypothetical protein